MGITLAKLIDMRDRGILTPGCRVLDIGSSNLYSADDGELEAFVESFGVKPEPSKIRRLAAGSYYGPNGGINESFVGELLEMAGLYYAAFDIAVGYKTVVFDLNSQRLPFRSHGAFDVVMNFGTTEHIGNHLTAFEAIHDALKVGGHMIHELPSSGYVDHGYFTYTPRFLFDIAAYNDYALEFFAYSNPTPGKKIQGIISDYASRFPALAETLRAQENLADTHALDISLLAVLRKTRGGAFAAPSEISTSVVKKGSSQLELGDLPAGSVPINLARYAEGVVYNTAHRAARALRRGPFGDMLADATRRWRRSRRAT
jgi:SAM-dependent methyltransferase